MDGLLEYFGTAFLINLPERRDRLNSAMNELARADWRIGPTGVQIYSAQKFTERAGFPGGPGVRGCFHSHLECIRMAHKAGERSVLLIEDDIALASSFPSLVPSLISQLESTPWDFLYLGHEQTGPIERANSRTKEVSLVPTTGEVRTTHLLAINGHAFSRLLEHLERVYCGREGDQEFGPMPVDGAYNVFRRINSDLRTLIANPKLGWQRPSRSDLSPRKFDSFKLLQPVMGALRNVKYAASKWRT